MALPPVQVNIVRKGTGIMAQPGLAFIYRDNQVIKWTIHAQDVVFAENGIAEVASPPAPDPWPSDVERVSLTDKECIINFNFPVDRTQGYEYEIVWRDANGIHHTLGSAFHTKVHETDPDISNQNQP